MQTDSEQVFMAIARKEKLGLWYILINSFALSAGKIHTKHFYKIYSMFNVLNITSCKMIVECDDGNVEVSKNGKDMFTIDEIADYIKSFRK